MESAGRPNVNLGSS